MLIGLVKWFDEDKGFGVVGTPDGEDYFLHIRSFIKKPEKILKGTPVAFSPDKDKLKNRNSVKNSRLIGNVEDWKAIFSFWGKCDSVKIEVEVTGIGKNGKSYHHRKIQTYSLINHSLKFFFSEKSEIEISNIIIDYFYTELDSKHFIAYCEFIENCITNQFSIEKVAKILNWVFSYFGDNLNEEIFFYVWKQKKFKFISLKEIDDFEIPENIVKTYILELGKIELNRILKYSYGSDFGSYFVSKKFSNIENLTSTEIKELYQYIEFETEANREKRKLQLDCLYVQKIENELIGDTIHIDKIIDINDLNNYKKKLDLIFKHLNIDNKIKEIDSINYIIAQKCSDEFKPEIWMMGIIKDVPFEIILKYFLNQDTQIEKRINILLKFDTKKQFELLKKYSAEFTIEKSFELLKKLIQKENSFDYNFNFSKFLYDNEFWKGKKGSELIELFTNYIDTKSNDEQKYELFLKGYGKNIPLNIIKQKVHQLENEDCQKIFKSISENKTFIRDILIEKVTIENPTSLSWLYDLAIEFIDQENFNTFDKKVSETIEQSEYFKFWERGKAKVFPKNQIDKILLDKFENYAQIKNWIENKITTKDEITDYLFSYLEIKELVTDRIKFNKQLNHIKYLLQLDQRNIERIIQIQYDFYNLILWIFDIENFLDFETLKKHFIYFDPDKQIRIIRKLFFLNAIKKLDLTIEKLDELTRFDIDLYNINLEFNPEIAVDISTDVVIKALLSYKQNSRFFVESKLLSIILDDLKLDKTRRFKLSNYFEDCLGRQTADFNWSTEGEIRKVRYGNNQFYFAVSFPLGETHWADNRLGGREVYIPNPNFENLKVEVKKIPGVKWNPNEKHWCIPSQYETEVLNFAKEYRFFLDFEGSNYNNNIHLAEFKRTIKQKSSYSYGYKEVPNIPNGISFCEGRLANKPHDIFKKEFWWCGGQPCFSKCETIHKTDEWEKYTLLDFCEILGLNTDETNKMGDYIPKGHYYQFIALINRFNRLLEKLYCKDCNHILYPFETGHFAANTVVRFQCKNEACSNNEVIYLNHCLNGQCNCIIDSRVSKRCDNGLFICDNCGSCCSHNMLERRLSNLKLTGGYIHNNLVKCVNEKLGHLERGEYFCYKCKSEMMEISNDFFQCSNCNIKYDTTKYKFKRPHKNLKKNISTNANNKEESNDDNFDYPF